MERDGASIAASPSSGSSSGSPTSTRGVLGLTSHVSACTSNQMLSASFSTAGVDRSAVDCLTSVRTCV
jgi:hypothetical protein